MPPWEPCLWEVKCTFWLLGERLLCQGLWKDKTITVGLFGDVTFQNEAGDPERGLGGSPGDAHLTGSGRTDGGGAACRAPSLLLRP